MDTDNSTTPPTKQHLAIAFQPHELTNPTPAKLTWIWHVVELAHQTGTSYALARQAVELADQATRDT